MARQSQAKQESSLQLKPGEEAYIATVVQQEIQQFSGPLPHPEIMKGYENLLPGCTERIIKMAEEEALHRHSIETEIIKMESRDSLLGVIFAFLLSIFFLGAGVGVILLVPGTAGTISGTIFGTSGFAGIVTTLIRYTRYSKKTDDEQ